TTAVPAAIAPARPDTVLRNAWAGTAIRMASLSGRRSVSAAMATRRSIGTPGNRRLSRTAAITAAAAASRANRVTVPPPRATTSARAVPQAPAPTTAMWSTLLLTRRPEARYAGTPNRPAPRDRGRPARPSAPQAGIRWRARRPRSRGRYGEACRPDPAASAPPAEYPAHRRGRGGAVPRPPRQTWRRCRCKAPAARPPAPPRLEKPQWRG